jgi:glycosyltransferase involved in cell wall biosynthesis
MRVAYSCHDSFPSPDTNTQQIFWTVFEVSRLGVDIDLIVPSPDPAPPALASHTIAAYYGAAPDTVPSGLAIRPVAWRRPAQTLAKGWFDWRSGPRLSGHSYDLVWTRDPLAALSCVRRGIPTVFETYRPDFARAARFAPWRQVALDPRALRGVIAHSRLAADAFVEAGVARNRCLVAHNGFAPHLMQPELSSGEARRRLGLPENGPLVVYAGHVGPYKGTAALVRIAAAVPEARLAIVGIDPASAEKAWIEALARDASARNLVLIPRVSSKEVSAYLYAADCLIVPPTGAPLRDGRTVLPMKIFTYLAAGRAVLAPRLPDIEEVVADGETACLVSPDQLDEAASTLKRLLADSAYRARLARNAKAAAENYTWEARARRLLGFFNQIHPVGKRSAA